MQTTRKRSLPGKLSRYAPPPLVSAAKHDVEDADDGREMQSQNMAECPSSACGIQE